MVYIDTLEEYVFIPNTKDAIYTEKEYLTSKQMTRLPIKDYDDTEGFAWVVRKQKDLSYEPTLDSIYAVADRYLNSDFIQFLHNWDWIDHNLRKEFTSIVDGALVVSTITPTSFVSAHRIVLSFYAKWKENNQLKKRWGFHNPPLDELTEEQFTSIKKQIDFYAKLEGML